MPTVRKSGVVLLLGCLVACSCWAQSFSSGLAGKKKVVLHRKLPAAAKLDGISTFGVARDAKSKDQADVAQSLADILITELQKNDKRLRESKNSPQMVISFTITRYEIAPPQISTRNESVLQKGHMVQVPKQYYRMIGALEVSYQAEDQKSGQALDSQNLSAKYNREFESGTNQATDKSLGTKFTDFLFLARSVNMISAKAGPRILISFRTCPWCRDFRQFLRPRHFASTQALTIEQDIFAAPALPPTVSGGCFM